jgi:hypothetical protein
MFSNVHIAGYRGFHRFDMGQLGRVNLIVGTNSSGKTSVLEALYLLVSRGDPSAIGTLLLRRGERLLTETPSRRQELDVSHMFAGHEAHVGSRFAISAKNRHADQSVTVSLVELSPKEQPQLLPSEEAEPLTPRVALQIRGRPSPPVEHIPMTRSGGILPETGDVGLRRLRRRSVESASVQFITTESVDSEELVALWDKVALTPNEELALGALRFVDPTIERIAAQAGRLSYTPSRGGFIVKTRANDMPVPIGSLGDGIWRMLAMAIAITQSAGGILLVDEIDTGLHYTVLSDMWRLIFRAAKDLDVQVFATTHSYDCIQSLAILSTETDSRTAVTVQRIEPGRSRAVAYGPAEIEQAAKHNIEVR